MAGYKGLDFQRIETVNVTKVDKIVVPEKSIVVNKPYLILLINRSDRVFSLACINYDRNKPDNKWFGIPDIGRNCTASCEDCFDSRQFSQVMACDCADAAFTITVVTKPDNNGAAVGATWAVVPTCDYAGGVACYQ